MSLFPATPLSQESREDAFLGSFRNFPSLTAEPAPAQRALDSYRTLGPRVGYMKFFDADEGSWFGGGQVRAYIGTHFALEGSIEFHRDEIDDGMTTVTQYPIQVTGLIYPFKPAEVRPYGLAGVGGHFTRVEFEGPLGMGEETDSTIGFHVGFGGDVALGPKVILNADVRYIMLDDPGDDDFDAWQLTVGVNFQFGK